MELSASDPPTRAAEGAGEVSAFLLLCFVVLTVTCSSVMVAVIVADLFGWLPGVEFPWKEKATTENPGAATTFITLKEPKDG